MKKTVITILLFFINFCFSQSKINKIVSFETVIDLKRATKDGVYLNGYVVNISYADLEKLDGKKVKITGKVTVIKGLDEIPKKYNSKGEEIIYQGRDESTKHIENPKIKIVI